MLCEKCHWYLNKEPFKYCNFCIQLDLPENIFCSCMRGSTKNRNILECSAYRPKLSLIPLDQNGSTSEINKKPSNANLTYGEKFHIGYTPKQLKINPDKTHFILQYHICLIVRKRHSILDSQKKFKNIFNRMHANIYNTQVEMLYMACDHIHLYVNIKSDLSLDTIVKEIVKISEKEIIYIYPEILNKFNTFWEKSYFAEEIGSGFIA